MKKMVLFLMIGSMMILSSNCTKEGPVGPAGPQGEEGPIGPQGPAGKDGESGDATDALVSDWKVLSAEDWIEVDVGYLAHDWNDDDITKEVLDNSLILVYGRLLGDSYALLPIEVDLEPDVVIRLQSNYKVGQITIELFQMYLGDRVMPDRNVFGSGILAFRYIIIPGGQNSGLVKEVDLDDYPAVVEYFKIHKDESLSSENKPSFMSVMGI